MSASSDTAARERIAMSGLDETLFVEAGAGTGKTAALVDRVVELVVSRGVPLAEIAAITFTEAAAAELADRIREQLERRSAEAESSGMRERCEAALADTDVAAISTLHSFAQRLLAEHPVEVGLAPHVEVLDEVSSQVEFDREWEEFVASLLDDASLAHVLAAAHLLRVRLTHSRLASLRDLAQVFDDNWDRLHAFEGDQAELSPIDREEMDTALRALLELERECRDPADRLAEHLRSKRSEVEQLLAAESDLDLIALLDVRTKWGRRFGRRDNWTDVESARAAVTAADDACDQVHRAATDAVLGRLAVEVARFVLDSAERRRREGRLRFHDLLVLARRLLLTSHSARRSLARRYTRLLLDEFQDTDPIQVEIAVALASTVGTEEEPFERWEQRRHEPGRLFFVGDPKQSIYRFRRADIDLYMRARDRFATDGGGVRLSQNHRTVPTILDWVNRCFSELMPEEISGRQPRYDPLGATRRESGADHRVVLVGGPHEREEGLRAAPLRELEAAHIAAVVDHIRTCPSAWPVYDRDAKTWRDPRLDEIAILLPTRTSLPQLEAALAARGIPARVDTGTLVYDTQEVRDVLSVMRAIADPSDEIAVVAALRSPLFGCGDDELLAFRAAGGRWNYRLEPPTRPVGDRVAAALEYLRNVSDQRWWTAPDALVERVVRERGAFEVAFAAPRARDVWRRLRFLVDQARLFVESQRGTLVDYLAWADLQCHEGSRVHEPLLPETDDESVRIMTIHGAKGLEFPITVVSGLTTEGRNSRPGIKVHWDGDGRPAIRLRKGVQTDAFDRLADLEGEMDEHERLRLLYVALTRARDHLVVSTHHNVGRRSHAEALWGAARGTLGELSRSFEAGGSTEADDAGGLPVIDRTTPAPVGADELRAVLSARRALLDAQAEPRSVSATRIARSRSAELAADDAALSSAADDTASVWAAGDDTSGVSVGRPSGRAGTAIGRAVHATLQVVDLATGRGVDRLAATHATLEGIPSDAAVVATLTRSVLEAAVVRAAVESGRYWRETYVAAPVGDGIVEGYVDLLFDGPSGLVVVDYKTDALGSDSAVDERVGLYRSQLAAYALALELCTGSAVADAVLVFAGVNGPIERSVPDLVAATAEVEALLRDE